MLTLNEDPAILRVTVEAQRGGRVLLKCVNTSFEEAPVRLAKFIYSPEEEVLEFEGISPRRKGAVRQSETEVILGYGCSVAIPVNLHERYEDLPSGAPARMRYSDARTGLQSDWVDVSL